MPGVMLRYTRRDAKGGQREWPSEGEKGGGGRRRSFPFGAGESCEQVNLAANLFVTISDIRKPVFDTENKQAIPLV